MMVGDERETAETAVSDKIRKIGGFFLASYACTSTSSLVQGEWVIADHPE
jgi:hypothetical protein